ncbi:MAG: conjugal transfer protein TrbG [Acidiphilium sp. 37-64-53]|uniref:TrbG/VirB9 family P-type conjugative transfer protein n=1 Tax=Acidiphilium TaxID=522 RepID=UPI000BCCC5BB|nr:MULTISPECIES: TrbG/VirB9 family P-type conjugative transfer protein [Acidiphilium]OYW00827.1 MAG: conjugal transfer protein TrbG [Acidiphilium sp. 37-64-53]HQT84927.1 TrbG/VirB9 family P-type conjugative transfer protein [Acidiphilium rubrum]
MTLSAKLAGAALAWLALSGSAWAVQYPQPGRLDSRVRYVPYEAGNVVNVWTASGAAMVIQFSPTEKVVSVAASDSVYLAADPVRNFLFFKPMAVLAAQPVYVLCQRANGALRRYDFQFETRPVKLGVGANVDYTVVFTYPHQEYERKLAAQRAAAARAVAQAAKDRLAEAGAVMNARTVDQYEGPRNYEYIAQGDRTLAPAEVWDNGYSTVFRFPGNQRIPALFDIQPDGKEATVNVSVHGDTVVVPGTAPEWRLRDGHTVLDVYDLTWNPIGSKPGTHTISPDVQRLINKPAGTEVHDGN